MPAFEHKITVYYSDTDAGGVVYFSNYFTFGEKARQEMLRQLGFVFPFFIYAHTAATFKSPARLGDELTIITSVIEAGATRLKIRQRLFRNNSASAIVDMHSTLAYVDETLRAARMPKELRKALEGICVKEHEQTNDL